MQLNDVKIAMHNSPFRAFRLVMTDGAAFDVNHPDFIAIPPKGRTIAVYGEGEDNYAMLDCYLIQAIEYGEIGHVNGAN